MVGCSVLLGLGCSSAVRPTLDAIGLHNSAYGYSVPYAKADARVFLSDEWILVSHSDEGELRSGNHDTYELRLDTNNDGHADLVTSEPLFEMRLQHKRDRAFISIHAMVLSGRDNDTRLDILLADHMKNISGTIYLREGETNVTSGSRAENAVKIGGCSGYEITSDIADVSRLHLTPGAIDYVVRVIDVRTPKLRSYERPNHETKYFPVVLMLSYWASSEVFSAHEAEFDRFAGSIQFEGSAPGFTRLPPGSPFVPPATLPSPEVPASTTSTHQ